MEGSVSSACRIMLLQSGQELHDKLLMRDVNEGSEIGGRIVFIQSQGDSENEIKRRKRREREREKKNMTDIKVSMETRLQVNSTEFPHRVGLTMIPSTVVWCVTCFVRECTGIY